MTCGTTGAEPALLGASGVRELPGRSRRPDSWRLRLGIGLPPWRGLPAHSSEARRTLVAEVIHGCVTLKQVRSAIAKDRDKANTRRATRPDSWRLRLGHRSATHPGGSPRALERSESDNRCRSDAQLLYTQNGSDRAVAKDRDKANTRRAPGRIRKYSSSERAARGRCPVA